MRLSASIAIAAGAAVWLLTRRPPGPPQAGGRDVVVAAWSPEAQPIPIVPTTSDAQVAQAQQAAFGAIIKPALSFALG